MEYGPGVRSTCEINKIKEIISMDGELHSMDPVSGRLRRSGNEWKPVHAIV
jgi:hypothetical protein